MVVLGVSVALLFVLVIVAFGLFSDALHPGGDQFRLLGSRQTGTADFEVGDGNCAYHPTLDVISLVRRHLAGECMVLG